MDTSLKSLKSAFRGAAVSSKYGEVSGVYAFMLITPSDAARFEELVSAYDEIHWLTGKHIRILGPSIVVDNYLVSREGVAQALRNRFDQRHFEAFASTQTRESYEFATFIGLPASTLPAIVLFDTLIQPKEFSVWKVGKADGGLVEQIRSLAAHLSDACKWREIDALQRLKSEGTGEIRNLQSKVNGKLARIENRKGKLAKELDGTRKDIFLSQILAAEHRIKVLECHLAPAREQLTNSMKKLEKRVKLALPVHDAVEQWRNGCISRYRINARDKVWDTALSSAANWSNDFRWRGHLEAAKVLVPTASVQQFFVERMHMGDNYSAGQAGAMGPGAQASNMTFQQIWNQTQGSLDLPKLARELATLQTTLRAEAKNPEHEIAIGAVAAAEASAKQGNGAKTLEYLKKAGSWAFDTATKIGAEIAAAALKSSMGLP
jgi:hypothetical protein